MACVHYGCLKEVFCNKCLKNVFRTLWMSQRCLLYVMESQRCQRYEKRKDFFCTLWMSQRGLSYVMNV